MATAKTKAAPAEPTKAQQREAVRQEKIKQVLSLKTKGDLKWPEIAKEVGLSIGRCQMLFKIGEAQRDGTVQKPTPAKVLKDRDQGKMSWDAIAVKYGMDKPNAQRLYREAGGNPHTSFIGKGGRYYDYQDQRPDAKKAAPKQSGAVGKTAAAKKAAAKKAPAAPKAAAEPKVNSLFAEDAPADTIKAKINGKRITTHSMLKGTAVTNTIKVKDESAKVGKQKDGTRVVQFTDADTGGTRTVVLSTIVKVGR